MQTSSEIKGNESNIHFRAEKNSKRKWNNTVKSQSLTWGTFNTWQITVLNKISINARKKLLRFSSKIPLKSITFNFFTRKLIASYQDNLQQAVCCHICVTGKPSRVCQYLDILHRDLHIKQHYPQTLIGMLPIKHNFILLCFNWLKGQQGNTNWYDWYNGFDVAYFLHYTISHSFDKNIN